ncbi:tetratricopeptide repeat protein [Methylomicrobium lacus]|uniref:tetratricopeptide repeat protein n=1 Tax=Methylomicrobium lacus TaxID=136992 RepID=UPI0035A95D1F
MPTANIRTAVLSCITALILSACSGQVVKPNLDNIGDNSDNILNLLDPSVNSEAEAFAKGETAFADGKTDNALFYYVKTLQYNKRNTQALEKIALIQSRGKHPELARNVYKEILSIDNNNAFANENLGLYLLENGNAVQAKGYLAQAVKHSNRQWKSHNGLGVIADLEHNNAEAIAHYEAALAIEPSNPLLLNNLGYSHYLAGNEAAARQFFNQALSLDNTFKRAINNLALIEIKHGAFPSASALLNRIMSPHESFNTIGYVCMIDGQYEAAEEYLRRAIDESPVYFPKAQENLNTLSSLMSGRPGNVPPARQAPLQTGPEIQSAIENPGLAAPNPVPSPAQFTYSPAKAKEVSPGAVNAQDKTNAAKNKKLARGYVHAADLPIKAAPTSPEAKSTSGAIIPSKEPEKSVAVPQNADSIKEAALPKNNGIGNDKFKSDNQSGIFPVLSPTVFTKNDSPFISDIGK